MWLILSAPGAFSAPAPVGTAAGSGLGPPVFALPDTHPTDLDTEVGALWAEVDADATEDGDGSVDGDPPPAAGAPGAHATRIQARATNHRRDAFVHTLLQRTFPAPTGGTRAPPRR